MPKLPNTTYALVGRCLTPTLREEQRESLAEILSRDGIRWERLLGEANRQQCTPLWYVRLREHGLLHLLPKDLQTYLTQLAAANRERNHLLRAEVARLLEIFRQAGIPVLLLNAAASFGDGLYADEGARLAIDSEPGEGTRVRVAWERDG